MPKGVKANLVGKRFGKLVVVAYSHKNEHGNIVWLCHCDCGNACYATTGNISYGRTLSCGCLDREHLYGKKYGRLTLVKPLGIQSSHSKWLCRCDCGNFKEVFLENLNNGRTKSCGCLKEELRNGKKKETRDSGQDNTNKTICKAISTEEDR